MVDLTPSVLKARVSHARRAPTRNSFAYGVDYLLLGEAELAGEAGPSLFSSGRRNLVSLRAADHGVGGEGGAALARRAAAEAGLGDVAHVALLTHPRYWGYAFNPVSFWFMTGADGALKAVLAEVHNTFGDRHFYLCRDRSGGPIDPARWVEAEKRFHVSPFFAIEGRYRFRFALEPDRIGVWIRYEDGRGGGLATALVGERKPLSNGELLRALARRPFGSLKTTTLIHWQALRLFLKGIPYRARPAPPKEPLT